MGVLVLPEEKEARAVDAAVQLNLNWNGFDPEDVDAYAKLANENGGTIGQTLFLTPDASFSTWTGEFENIPVEAVKVKFSWTVNHGEGEPIWTDTDGWTPAPPIIKDIFQPLTTANAQAD